MKDVVVLGTIPSDAHSWNLLYVQLLIEEHGLEVVNLGPCTPISALVEACERRRPRAVVLSTLNGHGYDEGPEVIDALAGPIARDGLKVVMGGMIAPRAADTEEGRAELRRAGYDAVFCGAGNEESFGRFLDRLSARRAEPLAATGGMS